MSKTLFYLHTYSLPFSPHKVWQSILIYLPNFLGAPFRCWLPNMPTPNMSTRQFVHGIKGRHVKMSTISSLNQSCQIALATKYQNVEKYTEWP
jgi:hypothetical protein